MDNSFVEKEIDARFLMVNDWFILFDNLYLITSVLPFGKQRKISAVLWDTETESSTRKYVQITLDNDHKIVVYTKK